MIQVICEQCKKGLTSPGAVLLSPPRMGTVKKYHLCKKCYSGIIDRIFTGKRKRGM